MCLSLLFFQWVHAMFALAILLRSPGGRGRPCSMLARCTGPRGLGRPCSMLARWADGWQRLPCEPTPCLPVGINTGAPTGQTRLHNYLARRGMCPQLVSTAVACIHSWWSRPRRAEGSYAGCGLILLDALILRCEGHVAGGRHSVSALALSGLLASHGTLARRSGEKIRIT